MTLRCARQQRPIARRVMIDSPAVFVPLTVVLELEWVMRGFYESQPEEFCRAIDHLLGMPHVNVERWEAVKDAIGLHRQGLDFADALHWSCSSACESLASIDDRKFVRRAARLGLKPAVAVPR